jgi:branched-chain amino acid transport system permease protein
MLVTPILAPSSFYLRVAAQVWVFSLAALGLTILTGYAGQISLGHAGFFGIGAYAVAIGPEKFGLHPLAALAAGPVIAGLVAYVVGRPILRLKGYYLAIATLGFGFIVALILQSEVAWTGGPDGMRVAKLALAGWKVSGAANWYWISAGFLLLGAYVALTLDASPTGRALRALHDSEVAAAGAGVDVARLKLTAFVLSSLFAATAGGLLGLMNNLVTPEIASFMHSVELIAMVIIGGLGSVIGAVLGAAFLILLPQVLTAFQDYDQAVLGFLIMVFMILLPDGIAPSLRKLFAERWP